MSKQPLTVLPQTFICLDEDGHPVMPCVDDDPLKDGATLDAMLKDGHWVRLRYERPTHPNFHNTFWLEFDGAISDAWLRLPHGTQVRGVA